MRPTDLTDRIEGSTQHEEAEEEAGNPDPHHFRPLVLQYLRDLQLRIETEDLENPRVVEDHDLRMDIRIRGARRAAAFQTVIRAIEREEGDA